MFVRGIKYLFNKVIIVQNVSISQITDHDRLCTRSRRCLRHTRCPRPVRGRSCRAGHGRGGTPRPSSAPCASPASPPPRTRAPCAVCSYKVELSPEYGIYNSYLIRYFLCRPMSYSCSGQQRRHTSPSHTSAAPEQLTAAASWRGNTPQLRPSPARSSAVSSHRLVTGCSCCCWPPGGEQRKHFPPSHTTPASELSLSLQ